MSAPEPWGVSDWFLGAHCSVLTRDGEHAALEMVSTAVKQRLDGLAGGSLEDDEHLLTKDASGPLYKALLVRRDEKYALGQIQAFIKEALVRMNRKGADDKVYW